jgi:quercetin dioxygenase-like cupin family protein
MIRRFLCAVALAAASVTGALAADTSDDKSRVTLVYDQVLPNVPGKEHQGRARRIRAGRRIVRPYPSKLRLHLCNGLGGAIRSQVNDGPVTTYRAGESFSEFPGDRHGVSENASATEPARLLAVFVVDTDETTLTTPYKK